MPPSDFVLVLFMICFVVLLGILLVNIPMLPNAPTLGEPGPNFFITSRVIGIPTLAHRVPENPPNCVLDGFITKAPLSKDCSVCLTCVYLSINAYML